MDPVTRGAARTATFIAVPVALLVVVVSVILYGSSSPEPAPTGPAASGPVEMSAPVLAADAAPVCQSVVSRLPDTVSGRTRRPVSAGAEQNAAYGEPPITLACGTAQPTVPPTADVFPLSGVCWYAEPGTGGTHWTTVDRTVPVTVWVPGAAEGSAQSVVGFSAAVAAGDPPRDAVPSGCR
jgi:Protein of unknown function (DUF3515)